MRTTTIERARLIQLTIDTALAEMGKRNTLSPAHLRLIEAMCAALIDLAHGEVLGRHAIAAPVGAGKTCCIKAAIKVLAAETTDTALLILQERIEGGRETLADLAKMGVDPALLGHVHSDGDGMTVPEGAGRRFVFATHARARMRSIDKLLEYNSKPRAAVVDEALHASKALGIRTNSLNGAIGWTLGEFEPFAAEGHPADAELVRWASMTRSILFRALETLKAYGRREGSVDLQKPDPEFVGRMLHKLRRNKNGEGHRLADIMEAATVNTHFRLLQPINAKRGGILQHRRILSEKMRDCLIMDAGAEVDELLALDSEVQLAHESLPQFANAPSPADVKDWSEVEVWRMHAPSGRSTMQEQYRKAKRDAWAPNAVAAFVRDHCPAGGNVLLCTFKGSEFRVVQEKALAEAGVDLKRIHWTTWGMHDASNQWQDVRAVVACGLLHRDRMELLSAAMGQVNDATAPLPSDADVSRIHHAFHAGCLYQLAGRGRCRSMVDGKAKPMVFAYIHKSEGPMRVLRRLMPGAVEKVWPTPPEALPNYVREGQAEQLVALILKELAQLAAKGSTRISSRGLWRRLAYGGSKDVKHKAIEKALRAAPWIRQGRTLIHVSAVFSEAG